jgi:hypothetical protein
VEGEDGFVVWIDEAADDRQGSYVGREVAIARAPDEGSTRTDRVERFGG